ncbi:hypothetical protein B9Z19DRAFT_1087204 [Tuber borchii]|uniref:Uncharacterized protein n=1 Tax=Tuber borchii TaxID=42251 RepID=A0A2T6ZN80_TUBBO|nr:hypothetical protein B9Z19DRAFT_1087204 [Tuber borchii]
MFTSTVAVSGGDHRVWLRRRLETRAIDCFASKTDNSPGPTANTPELRNFQELLYEHYGNNYLLNWKYQALKLMA